MYLLSVKILLMFINQYFAAKGLARPRTPYMSSCPLRTAPGGRYKSGEGWMDELKYNIVILLCKVILIFHHFGYVDWQSNNRQK